jgi:hypothetical protein
MSGTIKIYLAFFVVLILGVFLFELNKPKQIDWSYSFNHEHKKPWGMFVLNEELKNIFPYSTIEPVDKTPYENYTLYYRYALSNYIFINYNIRFDEQSFDRMLQYVNVGNTIFISAVNIDPKLLDTLGLEMSSNYHRADTLPGRFSLSNSNFPKSNFVYNYGLNNRHFSKLSDSTLVLGHRHSNDEKHPNYVKVPFGDGAFLLNSQPFAFTNYYMLKDQNADYVAQVFSYIDDNPIFWDRKYKVETNSSNSTLAYIASNPALKWAWRLMWLGLLIFVIFTAKRRQRAIPVIEPQKNTSLAFAKTIGSLYYQQGNPKDIVSIKIQFFLEDIRKKYMLETHQLDQKFINKLSQKTGLNKDEISGLINYIIQINQAEQIEETSLIELNKMLEQFYIKAKL